MTDRPTFLDVSRRLHQSAMFRAALGKFGPAVRGVPQPTRGRLTTFRRLAQRADACVEFGTPEIVPATRRTIRNLPSDWPKLPTYRLSRPSAIVLDDVWLIGEHATPVTRDGRVLLSPYRNHPWSFALERRADVDDFVRTRAFTASAERVHDGTLLSVVGRFDPNYFHWLTESCAQLEVLEVLRAKMAMKATVLTRSGGPAFQAESVRIVSPDVPTLGWNPAQGPLLVKRLVVPWQPGSGLGASPRSLAWLRARLLAAAGPVDRSDDRIYISRRPGAWRAVVNEDDVNTVLARHHVRPVQPESLSLLDQVRMCAGARLIVGLHGAGLTNLIAAPHAALVELRGAYGGAEYVNLAACLGAPYRGVRCSDLANDDVTVPTDELDRALADLDRWASTRDQRRNP